MDTTNELVAARRRGVAENSLRARWQERVARRMCIRRRIEMDLRHLDYRYWQCRSCGFDADSADVWGWWKRVHWRNRDELVRMSRALRLLDAHTSKSLRRTKIRL